MPRPAAEKRGALRSILEGDRLQVLAAVFDPVSARIAEQAGLPCGFLSGALVSFSRLGEPDLTVLTLDELAGQARQITRASGLPILADGDHGYGGPLNVRRTVEELELAGVAGVVLEDTDLPALGAGPPGLLSVEQACGKFRAAIAARSDPALVIAARTNLAALSPDDAVRRLDAYWDTGVDALFLAGVAAPAAIPALKRPAPLILLPAPGSALSAAGLADSPARLLLKNGHDSFVAAMNAMSAVYANLAESGLEAGGLDRRAFADLDRLTGGAEARAWLSAYGAGPAKPGV